MNRQMSWRILPALLLAAPLALSGCGSQAATVVTSVVPTTLVRISTVVSTAERTATVTATVTPGIPFDSLHTEVRTASGGAFDGWPNDVMAKIEDMVCGMYHPKDSDQAITQAVATSSALMALGVKTDDVVPLQKIILAAKCPGSLGFFPNL